MSIADSVLVFAFLFAAVLTSGASFWLKKPLMWLIAAIMWILNGMNGLRLTEAPWDAMAFLFWMSIGLMIACVLMILQTRRMEQEEEKGEKIAPDDADNYMREAGEYADKQRKVSEATGGRRVRKRK